MKQLLSTLSAISIMATSIFPVTGCSNSNPAVNRVISFYNVPLVCFAAPEIGCGSLTQPLFIEATQVKEIKDIWLNRTGTRIAALYEQGKENCNKDGKGSCNPQDDCCNKKK